MVFVFWLFFTILIGVWANKWNHSWILWVIISLITTPLIAGMILLLIGTDHPKCPSCKEVVKAGSRICKHCGQKFKEKTA